MNTQEANKCSVYLHSVRFFRVFILRLKSVKNDWEPADTKGIREAYHWLWLMELLPRHFNTVWPLLWSFLGWWNTSTGARETVILSKPNNFDCWHTWSLQTYSPHFLSWFILMISELRFRRLGTHPNQEFDRSFGQQSLPRGVLLWTCESLTLVDSPFWERVERGSPPRWEPTWAHCTHTSH